MDNSKERSEKKKILKGEWEDGGAHYLNQLQNDDEIVFTAEGCINNKKERLEEAMEELFPPSYTSNSNKEELCHEFVDNFRIQYEKLFPKKDKLYLTPFNECKVQKFVCTTVRPTLLPYEELYDAISCGELLSGLMEYEPLQPPTCPPDVLPSPLSVMNWRKGDCFDLSNLLASFLIGSGYDAYIVHGYAPKYICLRDQSKTICPVLENESDQKETNDKAEPKVNNLNTEGSSYKIRERYVNFSKYQVMQDQKDEKNFLEEPKIEDYDFDIDDEEEKDHLEGRRVHAWVLVRAGRRDVTDHFFIEPSTGRRYAVYKSPYERINALWNHRNYWVNMQLNPLNRIIYDLNNSTDWEYILITPTRTKPSGELNEDAKLQDGLDPLDSKAEAIDQLAEEENILDLPPCWSPKVQLKRDVFKERYINNGHLLTLYHKAKFEKFSENRHPQGMVMKLTIYRDITRNLPIECREYFMNRKDKLKYRVRYPLEGRIIEEFLPGRVPEALQKKVEILGTSRLMYFYTSARVDGLIRREEIIQKKSMEFFEGRDDRLIYRSVSVTDQKERTTGKASYTLPGGPLGELLIRKMTQKFERNLDIPADEDIYKRTFDVNENNIKVQYHYVPGKISASQRIYYKSGNVPFEVINVDPNIRQPKESVLKEDLQGAIQSEKVCYTAVRHAELEAQDLLKYRKREEASISLESNIFENAKDNANKIEQAETNQELKEESVIRESDYLTPFLQHVANPQKVTREEAQKAKDLCLRALKERLLERANIIQTRLDEENAQLAKKQAAFQRSQSENDHESNEEFETFCSEAMFRIQILEQRLQRHEEAALQKYADLDQKLHNDPRLHLLQ